MTRYCKYCKKFSKDNTPTYCSIGNSGMFTKDNQFCGIFFLMKEVVFIKVHTIFIRWFVRSSRDFIVFIILDDGELILRGNIRNQSFEATFLQSQNRLTQRPLNIILMEAATKMDQAITKAELKTV